MIRLYAVGLEIAIPSYGMGIKRSSEEECAGPAATAGYDDGDAHTLPWIKDAASRTEANDWEVRGGRPAHILVG